MVGYWGTTVAVLVYAYEQGGTSLVGVAACARLLPAALASPYGGVLADRHPRERVLVVGDLLRMTTLASAAAAVALDASVALVLTLIAVNAAIFASFRPALRALTPTVARSTGELERANIMASAVESIGMLAGPALGGALLVAAGPSAVFAAAAGTLAVSAALVCGVHPRDGLGPTLGVGAAGPALAQLAAAADAVKRDRRLRLIVLLTAGQTAGYGALSVLIVSLVGDVLAADAGWIGYLNAALGLGGLLGALVVAPMFCGRPSCASVGFALWGLPLCVIGFAPSLTPALIALAVVGAANTLVDVSLNTSLQQLTPPALLARVFALLGLVGMGSIAVGGLLAPVAVALVGTRCALVGVGLSLVLLALCAAPRVSTARDLSMSKQRSHGSPVAQRVTETGPPRVRG
jgi:MFS family permease